MWVHVVLWGLLTPLLAFFLLRVLKATLIALQYKHKAEEGRLAHDVSAAMLHTAESRQACSGRRWSALVALAVLIGARHLAAAAQGTGRTA